MSNWGSRLGRNAGAFQAAGVGVQIDPQDVPQQQDMLYGAFTGIDESAAPSLIPFSSGIRGTIDTEVLPDGALVRAPGIAEVEDALGHSFKYAFTQTSPDGAVELLIIDPPFIGVRTAGATVWTNVGLPATSQYGWVAANHGGVLVFSDAQTALWRRDFGAAAISVIPGAPPCRTIASIAGRVFIGAPFVAGNFQNLTMEWSDSTSDPSGWDPTLGAGAEDLIEDLAWADRIVALRPLGRNILTILLRNSIWMGSRTGDLDRPLDFASVIPGVGCIWETTARTTRGGVVYVSDDGIHNFDGNDDRMISSTTNQEIIPIDFNNIIGYGAAFDPNRKRYILITPSATWVYEFAVGATPDFPQGRAARWFKRSFIADGVFSYSDQAADPNWDDLEGTWDTLGEKTWDELVAIGINSPSRLFFASGTKLGRENYGTFQNFGVDFTGYWRGTPGRRDNLSGLVVTYGIELEYRSGGRVLFSTPDVNGLWAERITVILPNQGEQYSGEYVSFVAEGLPGLEIALLPPVQGDILVTDLIVEPGDTVTLLSPSETPQDLTSEVLGDGVLITVDQPGPFISPEIARVRLPYVAGGPKMTSNILTLR